MTGTTSEEGHATSPATDNLVMGDGLKGNI